MFEGVTWRIDPTGSGRCGGGTKSSVHGGKCQTVDYHERRAADANLGSTTASKKTTIAHDGLQDGEAVEVSRVERTVMMKWGVEKKRAEKICARVRLLAVVRVPLAQKVKGRAKRPTLYPVIRTRLIPRAGLKRSLRDKNGAIPHAADLS